MAALRIEPNSFLLFHHPDSKVCRLLVCWIFNFRSCFSALPYAALIFAKLLLIKSSSVCKRVNFDDVVTGELVNIGWDK